MKSFADDKHSSLFLPEHQREKMFNGSCQLVVSVAKASSFIYVELGLLFEDSVLSCLPTFLH